MAEQTGKHFYDQTGAPTYRVPKDQLVALYECDQEFLGKKLFQGVAIFNRYWQLGSELESVYRVHEALGSPISGETLDQWWDKPETDPVKTQIKRILRGYIQEGYLLQEVMLLWWSVATEFCLAAISLEDGE